MRTLDAVFAQHHGLARRHDLEAAGYGGRTIASMVKAGSIERARIGWYLPRDADPFVRQAIRVGGRLACVSAADRAGLWAPHGGPLHIAVPVNASRFRSRSPSERQFGGLGNDSVLLHWTTAQGSKPRAVSALSETLAQVIRCQPTHFAIATLDSALFTRAIAASELEQLLTGTAADRKLLALLDGRAESGIESIVRVRLTWAGISCDVQVSVAPGIRVDILIDGWLVVELDGSAHHSGPTEFEADRARDASLAVWGFRALHFSYRQVMDDWDFVLLTIETVRKQGAPARRR